MLKNKRKVNFVRGRGTITSPHSVVVEQHDGGEQTIEFENLIIATGSVAHSAAVHRSRLANMCGTAPMRLELREIPDRLLVIGGGYIGMEMGTVYAALGSKVTVVEALGSIIAAADPDLVAPVLAGAENASKKC